MRHVKITSPSKRKWERMLLTLLVRIAFLRLEVL